MRGKGSRAALLALVSVVGLASGCVATKPAPSRPKAADEIAHDPCAERLHDLSGRLLLYYAAKRRLPKRLADLPAPHGPVVCPVSGNRYIYDPEGVVLPERPGRLVLYDPAPSHLGGRWGISLIKSAPGAPLTTRVIWVKEAVLRSALSHPPPKPATR